MARSEVKVVEAIATSAEAERTLWSFLHGIDLTVRVEVFVFDPGSPLPLLVRDPRALNGRVTDGLWLRLVTSRRRCRPGRTSRESRSCSR